MDIEMIQFTGLLSIMLLLGWILIMVVFLIISDYVDKAKKEKMPSDEEQMKYLKRQSNGGEILEKGCK